MRALVVVAVASWLAPALALAGTYAHISPSGELLDPQENESEGQYVQRFNPQTTGKWQVIVEVPAGAKHNARYLGRLEPGSKDFLDPKMYVNRDQTYADGTEAPADAVPAEPGIDTPVSEK